MDEKTLRAAFLPFGDVTDVQIPLDPNSKGLCSDCSKVKNEMEIIIFTEPKHRGFGFVEFELNEARYAIGFHKRFIHRRRMLRRRLTTW